MSQSERNDPKKIRGQFSPKSPSLALLLNQHPQKGARHSKRMLWSVGGSIVLGVLVILAWNLVHRDEPEDQDVLVGDKNLIYSGGESSEKLSSVDESFAEDRSFAEKLKENYNRSIVQTETPVQDDKSGKDQAPPASSNALTETQEIKSQRFYIVQPGDNLSKIAGYPSVYGKRSEWTKIFEANREVIKRPDDIRVGQKLIIPE